METLSGNPLVKGNRVELLVDGPATFAAMSTPALAQEQQAAESTAKTQAEDQEPEFAGEIVVTARRRAEMLQQLDSLAGSKSRHKRQGAPVQDFFVGSAHQCSGHGPPLE
jgi:hypothetical protein